MRSFYSIQNVNESVSMLNVDFNPNKPFKLLLKDIPLIANPKTLQTSYGKYDMKRFNVMR